MRGAEYFDTPERAERLQLLLHLLNNTPEVLYLRAPNAAGKTRFAQQVGDRAEPDYQVIWLMAGTGQALSQQFPHELDVPRDADPELNLLDESASEKPVLLIVDNADALQPDDLADLHELRRSGTRILLLGTGHLAAAGDVPAPQFVDLPPFSEAQTLAFIQAQGKLGPDGVDERMALGLHRAAAGSPGPLLDALATIPSIGVERDVQQSQFPWRWVIPGTGLALLFVAALLFQDRINDWFQPPVVPAPPAVDMQPVMNPVPLVDTEAPSHGDTTVVVETEQKDVASDIAAPEASDVNVEMGAVPEAAAPVPPKVASGATDSMSTAPGAPESAAADPVLDAVIEEAISAAGQEGQTASKVEQDPIVSTPAGAPELAAPATTTKKAVTAADTGEERPKNPEAAVAESKITASHEKAAEPVSETTGHQWLRAQPAQNFTLQLVGSRDRSSIDQFIHRYGIAKPYAVFVRDLGGKPWHSLVSGSYPSRESAIAARAKLPKGIAGVWPRTFASIREQLRGR